MSANRQHLGAKAPRPQAGTGHASGGSVRIIGGQWRRSVLPVAAKPGLRPTPDRVRETLFNWLGQDVTGLHCVDAFAGSGALGFEAASRHAASVLLVEHDAQVAAQLHANAQRLRARTLQVRRGDGVQALATPPQAAPAHGWDIAFIDPPYAANLEAAALAAAHTTLAPQGVVYLESNREWPTAELAELGWLRTRHLRAGQVHAHLLTRPPGVAPET